MGSRNVGLCTMCLPCAQAIFVYRAHDLPWKLPRSRIAGGLESGGRSARLAVVLTTKARISWRCGTVTVVFAHRTEHGGLITLHKTFGPGVVVKVQYRVLRKGGSKAERPFEPLEACLGIRSQDRPLKRTTLLLVAVWFLLSSNRPAYNVVPLEKLFMATAEYEDALLTPERYERRSISSSGDRSRKANSSRSRHCFSGDVRASSPSSSLPATIGHKIGAPQDSKASYLARGQSGPTSSVPTWKPLALENPSAL